MTQQSHALETTRELATLAVERTGENLRDLREGIKDASADAQRQLGRYARQTNRYVSKRPVMSALMVAAVAAAVTALPLAVVRNKRRHS